MKSIARIDLSAPHPRIAWSRKGNGATTQI